MITCQSCGDPRQDKFCPNCGEKKFNAGSLAIGHLIGETFEGLSHFDTRFFRSLKTLLIRPAELSVQFCNGITVRYMKPFSFFLVANLIFFLVSFQNPFGLPIYNYMNYEYKPFNTRANAREAVVAKLRVSKLTEKELATAFNEKIRSSSKIFIALFIPFFAIVFALVFVDRRRRFGEHLVFATHLMTFLICLFLIEKTILSLLHLAFPSELSDLLVSSIVGLIFLTYLSVAVHRFYVKNWWRAILSSLVIVVLLTIAMQTYRIFLFYKVLNAI